MYIYAISLQNKENPQKEPPFAFYIPDWNTHTDDILNNIYRYLDFCREDHCGLHVALSKAVLDSNRYEFGRKV